MECREALVGPIGFHKYWQPTRVVSTVIINTNMKHIRQDSPRLQGDQEINPHNDKPVTATQAQAGFNRKQMDFLTAFGFIIFIFVLGYALSNSVSPVLFYKGSPQLYIYLCICLPACLPASYRYILKAGRVVLISLIRQRKEAYRIQQMTSTVVSLLRMHQS